MTSASGVRIWGLRLGFRVSGCAIGVSGRVSGMGFWFSAGFDVQGV